MHKKYTKHELAEFDEGTEKKVKKKHKEHKKEKDVNQVLFLKYDPVKFANAKGEKKREKSNKDHEHKEHAVKQKSGEANSDNVEDIRIKKNVDEREKLHKETMRAYEKYRKHIRKFERGSKLSTSSLNVPKEKKATRLRKENTIHLETPSQDMPIFKPFTAVKIDEKKHKSKKLKKEVEALAEKQSRGEGDAQKQQVLYCQIETETPFKNTDTKRSEVRVAFAEHHKKHGSKRKCSSEAIRPHKSHRQKSSARHRKHLPLDEYIFHHHVQDKHNTKVTELFNGRDGSSEPRKQKRPKSQVNVKSRKHSSTDKDKSSKGTEDIKSYFEKIQAAIDKKIDTLLGPRQRHSSNELSLETNEKTRIRSKDRHRSPHKKHHSSSRGNGGARELSRKRSMVQSMSDSRVHLKSSDLSANIDGETLKVYLARLAKKEKSDSQQLNNSSESKKSSKSKTNEFKVEGVEPPNLQSKKPQKKHANRNLECKTVSIIGIPSSIQGKSIMLNNTQTNTSLKFSNSVEDIVEKKKKSKRFKLYYKYSMDSNAVTNSLNSDEQSIVSDSYRLLTDQSDHENTTTETKCDIIPIKLTFQKTEPKKSQDALNKRQPHKHRRRENLIKLNDIIEERHDTPSELFKRGPSPNRDIHYEFFRALHSSNSEYGLSTVENRNTDLFGEFNLNKNLTTPKQADMKFYLNKSKKKQKHRWKYISKSDVNVSYDSLCTKAAKKKPLFEPRPRCNSKGQSKEKRLFHHRKEKTNTENGDQAMNKKQAEERLNVNEDNNDIGMKEYLKKIYDISMEIKKKFFENGDLGRPCKDSQMFDLLCLTDPRNLFSTIESTSKTSNMRRERIQHLQSLSSNMSRGLQEANRESRVKNFDSHTHREKIYQIQSVSTNNSRSIASQEVKSPEGDAQDVCTSFMTDTSRMQMRIPDSRDLSSNVESTDNFISKIPHLKRDSCLFGKNIKTQTLQISEVGVSTIRENTINQNVQTSKGNVLTTVDAAIETYDIGGDKPDQPQMAYNKYIREIISTVRKKETDDEMCKKHVVKKPQKLDKSKLHNVRSNQKCKSVFYRYRRLGNINVISSPSPIEQIGRKGDLMNDKVRGSNRSSSNKKWCPVETVYVPRKDSETIQEDVDFVPTSKQYISKEIISVNVPVKSSTACVVDKQSRGKESETFMAQKMIEKRPSGDYSGMSLQKRSKSASSVEVIVDDDASSNVASLICLQKFMNDAAFTMSSRDTSQMSDRTDPPHHTTMMLTKQYKTSELSSYQKRKMYDNMIRKKMKKRPTQNGPVFEVRFMSLDRQRRYDAELSLFPNKEDNMQSKVISAINRVSEIKKGMIRSGIESVFVNKYKIYEFCQYLTKGDASLFNETYFGCKSCSYDWNLDDNIDDLVDFLRKSISLFYKCGCKTHNVVSLRSKDNDIHEDAKSGEPPIDHEAPDENDEEDRETTSTAPIHGVGLISSHSDESGYTSIQSEQSGENFFKKPNIAALMCPPSELQQKRSKLFRSNVSNTGMTNYDQMARQCQEYAHKVRCHDSSRVNQSFEEIPLDVLLAKKSLVSVESFVSTFSSCPQFFDDRNVKVDSGYSRMDSEINISPDAGSLSMIPSMDSMDSCLESTSILNQILGNKVVLSSTNLNCGCITLTDKVNDFAKPFLRAPTTKEKKKMVVKNFFDNLLGLYEKEMAVGYALSTDNHFFENELLTLVCNDNKETARSNVRKPKKKKGLGNFFMKMFRRKKIVVKPEELEVLEMDFVSKKIEKLEDDHQRKLQFLARSTRKYFSPFVEAVKMNRDIDDEVKICGFLKLLDMIENGHFTFIKQSQQSEDDIEQEIRNQVKESFTNVYRAAKLSAEECNRDLTHVDIDLLRTLVCKYRIGLLSSMGIIAKFIGNGCLNSEAQLKCKFMSTGGALLLQRYPKRSNASNIDVVRCIANDKGVLMSG